MWLVIERYKGFVDPEAAISRTIVPKQKMMEREIISSYSKKFFFYFCNLKET